MRPVCTALLATWALAMPVLAGPDAPANPAPPTAGDPASAPATTGHRFFPGFSGTPFTDGAIAEPEVGKPIVFVVIDALRPQNLSTYGYSRDTSPTLTQFAGEGLLFTDFFANAPWTKAATTSMLTGRFTAEHRTQGHKDILPADVGTFAQQLRKAGYTTLAVVGNGNASSAFGLHKGFDVYRDTASDWEGLPNAQEVFELGIEVLKPYRKKKKVFLFLFVLDPHYPYEPPPPYDTRYFPEYDGGKLPNPHWEYKNNYAPKIKKKMIANYDGEIRFTDDQFAWLIGQLKKLGVYDEASIFVTADHGESFGEHQIYRHGHHHYETHIHIPLMIRAPWLKERGSFTTRFFQQIDLFPTFCALAGAKYPKGLRGISIVDGLKDPAKVPPTRYVISEYNCYGIHRSAIRTPKYKLVYQRPAEEELFMKTVTKKHLLPSVSFDKEVFHLYDMVADPFELKNLWPKLKDTVGKRLLAVLKEEIRERGDAAEAPQIDPALIEELRSMGYVQ